MQDWLQLASVMNLPRIMTDEDYMKQALDQARTAAELGEVPVGAVIVMGADHRARAHNLCERLRDFTAHAEMQAFTSASEYLGGKFLDQCTLYVTLEPCPMCSGAHRTGHRIGRVVYGAWDDKRGGLDFHGKPQRGPAAPQDRARGRGAGGGVNSSRPSPPEAEKARGRRPGTTPWRTSRATS